MQHECKEERQTEDSDEKSRDRRMCISPGDNRNMSGDYSVQMWRIQVTTMRKSRNCGAKQKQNKKWIQATASKTDRQKHWVLSMYSVHRKNPQCVLANITQLRSDWFNYMCVSERAPCRLTSPLSPPTGTETPARAPQSLARCLSSLFFFLTFTCTESRHYKWTVICGKQEQLAFDAEQCGGDGRNSVIQIQSSLKSLVKCCYRVGEKEQAETLTRSHKPTCTLSG